MEPIGEEQAFVYVEGRKLRRGYTTGTSAAAAAGAAARLLLTGAAPPYMRILTPKGIDVAVEVVSAEATQDCARASVRKDGGDDADDTHGAEICAEVSRIPEGDEVDALYHAPVLDVQAGDDSLCQHAAPPLVILRKFSRIFLPTASLFSG